MQMRGDETFSDDSKEKCMQLRQGESYFIQEKQKKAQETGKTQGSKK